jgi:hypothetical protein
MSTTEHAQKTINLRADWIRQRDLLKEQVQQSLVVAANGSFFSATAETINLVKVLIDQGYTTAVLLDSNQLPCQIDNLGDFLTQLVEHNQQVLNLYQQQYATLARTRRRG